MQKFNSQSKSSASMSAPKGDVFSGQVGAYARIENAPVAVLSAVHEPGGNSKVPRNKEHKFKESKGALRRRTGQRGQKSLSAMHKTERFQFPFAWVTDYNQHMVWFDMAGQFRMIVNLTHFVHGGHSIRCSSKTIPSFGTCLRPFI